MISLLSYPQTLVVCQGLRDCPDELWETDLWPAQATTAPAKGGGLWGSAPWLLAHHTLLCLDYDLTGT